jgi:gliding motility-associated-like protein
MYSLFVRKLVFILVLLISAQTNYSQLCTGSLGDPVAWITFGQGSGSSPLPPGNTSYTFVGSQCPDDGQYTLTDLTFGCFGSSWHTLIGDHTPDDAIGKYMLVNASFFPGDFFTETITGLCPNTIYELSAWIINILKSSSCSSPILPNLTFRVETVSGTELVKYDSGDIPMTTSPVWKQYGTFFQTPANTTTVVIRITNNAPGGCGNDLALDDITFRPCGPTINAVIATNGLTNYFLCEDQQIPFLLSATYSNAYSNPTLQWQQSNDNGTTWTDIPGAISASFLRQPSGPGFFKYRILIGDGVNISNPQCRIASNPIIINVHPIPFVQATNYVFGCYGSTIILFAAGGSFYHWSGPNGFTSENQSAEIPNVKFTDAGLYKVTVTTNIGCVNSDSTNLVVYPAAHASISSDVSICEGKSTKLNSSGGIKYRWDPRAGLSNDTIPDPIARPKDSTVYKVIVFNEYSCYDTATVRVNVWRKPIANAGPDLKMLVGSPIRLKGSASGTLINYSWIPLSYMIQSNSLTPVVNPPETITFKLIVNSTLGCGTSDDEVLVKVFEKIPVPNAFSPNGDGINDKWTIDFLENFPECQVEIFSRYGQVVYRSVGYNKPWDGTFKNRPVPAGTYYYIVNLKNGIQKINGFVDVLR